MSSIFDPNAGLGGGIFPLPLLSAPGRFRCRRRGPDLGGGIFPLPLLSVPDHAGAAQVAVRAWRGNIPPPFVERSMPLMSKLRIEPWRGNIPPPFVERTRCVCVKGRSSGTWRGNIPPPFVERPVPVAQDHRARRLGGGIFPLPLLSEGSQFRFDLSHQRLEGEYSPSLC